MAASRLILPFAGNASVLGDAVVRVINTYQGTSGAAGVLGQSDGQSGTGVFGVAAATSGVNAGVVGQSASTDGSGVLGQGSFGVHGITSRNSGRGVFGQATAATGDTFGVYGESNSTSGRAVYGRATAASGTTYGGLFETSATDGRAVAGLADATTGTSMGGLFVSHSPAGFGVLCSSNATSGPTYGLYAIASSPDGQAGFFQNTGLSPAFDVEISGPNGAINTPGFVYHEYTASTPSAAIPIAYGSVSAAGVINGGTGNFTVAHTVTGEYDVTISGETYSNNSFVVTITPATNSPRITGVADVGVPFRVNMWNLAGDLVDNAFQFTVWKANPAGPG
jgi:hypothetical protein